MYRFIKPINLAENTKYKIIESAWYDTNPAPEPYDANFNYEEAFKKYFISAGNKSNTSEINPSSSLLNEHFDFCSNNNINLDKKILILNELFSNIHSEKIDSIIDEIKNLNDNKISNELNKFISYLYSLNGNNYENLNIMIDLIFCFLNINFSTSNFDNNQDVKLQSLLTFIKDKITFNNKNYVNPKLEQFNN